MDNNKKMSKAPHLSGLATTQTSSLSRLKSVANYVLEFLYILLRMEVVFYINKSTYAPYCQTNIL